jgi:hypothetical protein
MTMVVSLLDRRSSALITGVAAELSASTVLAVLLACDLKPIFANLALGFAINEKTFSARFEVDGRYSSRGRMHVLRRRPIQRKADQPSSEPRGIPEVAAKRVRCSRQECAFQRSCRRTRSRDRAGAGGARVAGRGLAVVGASGKLSATRRKKRRPGSTSAVLQALSAGCRVGSRSVDGQRCGRRTLEAQLTG